jgi:uncharacterized protein YdeI (YjbR/CyaY-like superfamily)
MDVKIKDYFQKDFLKWKDEQLFLRDVILQFGFEEDIKWGRPTYSLDGKNLIGLSGFKNYFTIWFFQGVFLKDESNFLVNAQEGKTKSLRHWQFKSQDEINVETVKTCISEVIDNHKSGKEVKVNRSISTGFVLEENIKLLMSTDVEFELAFNKLTPGKQKEYSKYIDEAKRESTKITRLEKIVPIVLKGEGLNDKYKTC